jgi:hypothetical protein
VSLVNTVVGIFVSVLVLVVLVWIAIFGGVGALLSRARGGSVPAGLAWGATLGPLGWLAVYWTTRTMVGTELELALPISPPAPDPVPAAPSRPERWDAWNR